MSNQAYGAEHPCPTCGTAAAPEASFCRKCGASLTGASSPRAAIPPAVGVPPPPGQPVAWGTVGPDGRLVAPQNGYAIAALVLGLVGLSSLLCGASVISSILAVVFGIIGRKKAAQGLSTNGGMATAGLVLGVIGVVVVGAALAFTLTSSNY